MPEIELSLKALEKAGAYDKVKICKDLIRQKRAISDEIAEIQATTSHWERLTKSLEEEREKIDSILRRIN